jgi:hypothetical protein
MVSRLTLAPCTSAKCAAISPVVNPRAVAVLTFSVAANGRRFDRATNCWVDIDTSHVFHSVVTFQA